MNSSVPGADSAFVGVDSPCDVRYARATGRTYLAGRSRTFETNQFGTTVVTTSRFPHSSTSSTIATR